MKLFRISSALLAAVLATTASAQTIHTTKLSNVGYHPVEATVTLNVGTWTDNTCVIDRSYNEDKVSIEAHTVARLDLSDETLADEAGTGYTCADRIIQTDNQTLHDTFKLYTDNGVYSGSVPNFFEASVRNLKV